MAKRNAGRGRPKQSNRSEMHGKNPKAPSQATLKKDAKDVKETGKKLVKDGMKKAADVSLTFYQKAIQFIRELPGNIVSGAKNFLTGIWEIIKNFGSAVYNFFKAMMDKAKLNKGAMGIKLAAGLIGGIVALIVGGQYVMTLVTLQQLLMICTGTTVVAYGVHRMTLPDDVREATEVKASDILFPKIGQIDSIAA